MIFDAKRLVVLRVIEVADSKNGAKVEFAGTFGMVLAKKGVQKKLTFLFEELAQIRFQIWNQGCRFTLRPYAI